MIQDKDRSGYIGASDTAYVMGSWNSRSFRKWWRIKLGLQQDHSCRRAMEAGNRWEHRILQSLGLPDLTMDGQYIIEGLKLRVNLDGNTEDAIYEVKTYIYERGYSVP